MARLVWIVAFAILFSISCASRFRPMIIGADIKFVIIIPPSYADNETGIAEETTRAFAKRMRKNTKFCVSIDAEAVPERHWKYVIDFQKYRLLQNGSAKLDEKWKMVNQLLDGSETRRGDELGDDAQCQNIVAGDIWIRMVVALEENDRATWYERTINAIRNTHLVDNIEIVVACTRFGSWSQPEENGPIDSCECVVADKSTIDRPFRTATIDTWTDKEFGTVLANALTNMVRLLAYVRGGNTTTTEDTTTVETTTEATTTETATTFPTTTASNSTDDDDNGTTTALTSTTTAITSPSTMASTSTAKLRTTSSSTTPSATPKRRKPSKSMRASVGIALIVLGTAIIVAIGLFLFVYWKRLYPILKKKSTAQPPPPSEPKSELPTYMTVRPSLERIEATKRLEEVKNSTEADDSAGEPKEEKQGELEMNDAQ